MPVGLHRLEDEARVQSELVHRLLERLRVVQHRPHHDVLVVLELLAHLVEVHPQAHHLQHEGFVVKHLPLGVAERELVAPHRLHDDVPVAPQLLRGVAKGPTVPAQGLQDHLGVCPNVGCSILEDAAALLRGFQHEFLIAEKRIAGPTQGPMIPMKPAQQAPLLCFQILPFASSSSVLAFSLPFVVISTFAHVAAMGLQLE
mmetsp:Transcript_9811/g.21580  ORF Transcript_9811/g.21580 Transcript_9811/m.21580 type:complete len:201 (+) Transcript_9811:613-1215(+)